MPRRERLAGGDIHLWLASVSAMDDGILANCAAMLETAELARCRRLLQPQHRKRALLSRVLQRTVLAHYLGLAPAQCRFDTGAHGKPHLAGHSTLEFNLSHSGDLVVCAVAESCALGVDVEAARPGRDLAALARRFFAPAEADAMLALPAVAQLRRFYQLWSLKESRLKATGEGLSLPLASFAFLAGAGGAVQLVEQQPATGYWRHWLTEGLHGYSLALSCLSSAPEPAGEVVVFRCQPPGAPVVDRRLVLRPAHFN